MIFFADLCESGYLSRNGSSVWGAGHKGSGVQQPALERVARVPQHDGHPAQRQALSVHLLCQPQAQQEGQSSLPYHNVQPNVFINLLSNYKWQKINNFVKDIQSIWHTYTTLEACLNYFFECLYQTFCDFLYRWPLP